MTRILIADRIAVLSVMIVLPHLLQESLFILTRGRHETEARSYTAPSQLADLSNQKYAKRVINRLTNDAQVAI